MIYSYIEYFNTDSLKDNLLGFGINCEVNLFGKEYIFTCDEELDQDHKNTLDEVMWSMGYIDKNNPMEIPQ